MTVHRRTYMPNRPGGSSSSVSVGTNVSSSPEENRELGDKFEDLLGEDGVDGTPESSQQRVEAERFSPSTLFSLRARERNTQSATLAAQQSTDAENAEQLQSNSHDRGGGLKRTATQARDERDKSDSDAAAANKSDEAKVESKKHQSHDQDSQGGDGSDGQPGAQTPDMAIAMTQPTHDVSDIGSVDGADDEDGERLTTDIASEVASRIMVERSASGGSTKVQIDLRQDVLPDTKATIEDKDGSLTVTLACGEGQTASMLQQHAEALEAAISDRTGRETHVAIETDQQSEP